MPHVLLQVVIPFSPFMPTDISINDFHWWVRTGHEGDDVTEAITRTLDFYNGDNDHFKICHYLAPYVNILETKCRVRSFIDGGDSTFQSEVDFVLAEANNTTAIPSEVSVCNSFRGAPEDPEGTGLGLPAGRRRGRVYIGPLGDAARGGSGGGVPRVGSNIITDLATATTRLADQNWVDDGPPAELTEGPIWCIYSKAASDGGATQLRSMTPVFEGWIDNEWDTQRRRGVAADARATWRGTAFT